MKLSRYPQFDLNSKFTLLGQYIMIIVNVSMMDANNRIRKSTTVDENFIRDQISEERNKGNFFIVAVVGDKCEKIEKGDYISLFNDSVPQGSYLLDTVSEERESYNIGLIFSENDVLFKRT